MHKKTNILLTGASGTVGYDVLKQLSEKPDQYDVTIFDKKSSKTVRLFSPFKSKAEIIYGDISDKESVEKVCKEKQFVIHLAAVIPPLADEEPELAHRVNTLGTKYLVKGLEKHSPDAFLLYSSSISVYGDRLHKPSIKVSDPLLPSEGDEYAKTKIAAEKIIQNSHLDWSIFRLTAIMGGHKISKLMFHMPLKTALEIATSKDTASAFVNAIERKEQLSKIIFNLGGGEKMRLSYEEFLSRSFEIYGLGELDFPKNTFAEKNFHCGYYADGDELENMLHFRKDTLATFFNDLNRSVSPFRRFFTTLLKKWIKLKLAKQSEPLNAIKDGDSALIERFFGKETSSAEPF